MNSVKHSIHNSSYNSVNGFINNSVVRSTCCCVDDFVNVPIRDFVDNSIWPSIADSVEQYMIVEKILIDKIRLRGSNIMKRCRRCRAIVSRLFQNGWCRDCLLEEFEKRKGDGTLRGAINRTTAKTTGKMRVIKCA
jgi:hypothetical protein